MTLNTDISLDNSAVPLSVAIKIAVAAEAHKTDKKAALKPLQALGKTVSDMGGGDKHSVVGILKAGNAFLQGVPDSKVYKAYKVLLAAVLRPQGYAIGLDGHPVLLLSHTKAEDVVEAVTDAVPVNDEVAQAAAFTE
jgi:hypothetical protein